MSTFFSSSTDDVPVMSHNEVVGDVDRAESRATHPRVDSNLVRWVFAANVAFWLAAYAAGRMFF